MCSLNIGEKPESNKEYLIVYSSDDTILLVPKLDELEDISPEGRELI